MNKDKENKNAESSWSSRPWKWPHVNHDKESLPTAVFFYWDVISDGVQVRDSIGRIIPEEEMMRIIDRILGFYESASKEAIEAHNQLMEDKQEEGTFALLGKSDPHEELKRLRKLKSERESEE